MRVPMAHIGRDFAHVCVGNHASTCFSSGATTCRVYSHCTRTCLLYISWVFSSLSLISGVGSDAGVLHAGNGFAAVGSVSVGGRRQGRHCGTIWDAAVFCLTRIFFLSSVDAGICIRRNCLHWSVLLVIYVSYVLSFAVRVSTSLPSFLFLDPPPPLLFDSHCRLQSYAQIYLPLFFLTILEQRRICRSAQADGNCGPQWCCCGKPDALLRPESWR